MIKVCFICNDLELIEKFNSLDDFQVVNRYDSLDEALSSHADIIIISDRFVTINELITREEIKSNYQKVYYMISAENLTHNTNNIISGYDIILVPPKRTTQQIFEFICSKELNYEYDNNIVVFFGADDKVGTTMICQTVAEIIAKYSDKKVFLGFFNGYPGVDYVKGKTPGNIDQIKAKLLDKLLSINDIIAECKQTDNLYILEGVNNFVYRSDYGIEDVELLLKIISENFDAVIIDAGSNIELALSFGSLISTKNRYLVTTPQKKAYNNFQLIYPVLEKLDINKFSLIINMYLPDFGKAFEVADKYNFNLACVLPYLDNGWQAEYENSTLYSYNDRKYCLNIETLSDIVSKSIGIDLSLPNRKKSFKFLLSRGVVNGRK